MSAKYYTNLCWDSYKEKLKSGFSHLQQREEFVDMTLSAEGCLIKVHKNIVALVSPYLREMINSTPCQHPVIFLSNISHDTLVHIVEYIYTGECQVPSDILPSFFNAASELHLSGLSNKSSFAQDKVQEKPNQFQLNDEPTNLPNFSSSTGLHEHKYGINFEPTVHAASACTRNVPYIIENELLQNLDENVNETEHRKGMHNENNEFAVDTSGDVIAEIDNDDTNVVNERISFNKDTPAFHCENNKMFNVAANISINKDYKPQQYSVSSRGSLQLILNRFIYYLHHHSNRGIKRRWRCFDYRRMHCKAYIDTMGEEIVERKNQHNHVFHDERILKKVEQNKIYGSISSIVVEKHLNEQSHIVEKEESN